jgi:hypothetical protein
MTKLYPFAIRFFMNDFNMGLALYSLYIIILCIDRYYVVQNCTKVNSRTWHNENEQSHIQKVMRIHTLRLLGELKEATAKC